MQLYGVFCILGLGLYGPQLWTGVCIVAYSGAVRIPRTPVCAMSLQGCRLLIHAFGGMGPFSNCGRCCRVNAPEVFVLSKCLAAFSEYALICKLYWGFAFLVWDCMCHNCGPGFVLWHILGQLESHKPQCVLCHCKALGSSYMPSVGVGPFQIVADVVGLKPQRFLH